MSRYSAARAMIRRCDTAIACYDTAGRARDTVRSARGWELGRDTTIVSGLIGGRPCVAIQCSQGCDTAPNALRHGAGALRHAWQARDTMRSRGRCYDTKFVS